MASFKLIEGIQDWLSGACFVTGGEFEKSDEDSDDDAAFDERVDEANDGESPMVLPLVRIMLAKTGLFSRQENK